MKNLSLRQTSVLLALVLLGGCIIPSGVSAQEAVYDAANFGVNTVTAGATSETAANTLTLSEAYQVRKGPGGSGVGLDSIAWVVAKAAIQMMTKSVVNWINSGFNGSPSFVTNVPGFLQNVGDVAAGAFINQLATNGSIRSPFQSSVAQSVGNQYYLSTNGGGFFLQNAYSLNQVTQNDAAFLGGDFSQGGWSAWFSASTNPQNNPYGAQILAQQALAAQVAGAQSTQMTQLGWGQGFLSWCGSQRSGSNSNANGGTDGTVQPVVVTSQVNPAETCTDSNGNSGFIQTPGSVIQNQINQTLDLSGNSLVSADEFNEVIGALMSQLTSQVLSAGLGAISSVSSGGGGYIDQASDPNGLTQAQSASGTTGTFITGADADIAEVNQYQTDLQTIQTEAQIASAALSTTTAPCASSSAAVASVLSEAQTELTRAAAAITTLQGIENDAVSAITTGPGAATASSGSAGASAALVSASTELQQFLASSGMPSAAQMAYVHQQAQDSSTLTGTNGNTASPTLFTQMKEIAAGQCATASP